MLARLLGLELAVLLHDALVIERNLGGAPAERRIAADVAFHLAPLLDLDAVHRRAAFLELIGEHAVAADVVLNLAALIGCER